jgi:uroporphyrinogen decarboxylase
MFRSEIRQPDFRNLLLILDGKPAPRPVLFDFILGAEKERFLTDSSYCRTTEEDCVRTTLRAFDSAGYDFAPIVVRGLEFVRDSQMSGGSKTVSINLCGGIADRESFCCHAWPEVENCDFTIIPRVFPFMSKGMKLIPFSVDGILENSTRLMGYENLCYSLYDDPQLVEDVFFEVGSRICAYFEKLTEFDEVGALLLNDDWGFATQTMIDPKYLRKLVFPWYRRIVSTAHSRGKAAILHSCGFYDTILPDILTMGFDGRHSYEDKIVPVEKAYEQLHGKIAVLGGIDVGFMANSTPDAVYRRCSSMLKESREKGGYALGSGNSVPDYISNENFAAMLRAANEGYEMHFIGCAKG